MKIAILQPTPLRKGHYFIYTKSLFYQIKNLKKKVKIISATRSYNDFLESDSTNFNFNIYSLSGFIIYLTLCFSTISRFLFLRNNFNRIIILDCEYTCVSFLLFVLKLANWKGKIILQINAPNFKYDKRFDGLNLIKILKFIQSFFLKKSLDLHDLKISCLGEWHKENLSKQLSFDKNKIIINEDGGGGDVKQISKEILIKRLKDNSIVFPDSTKKIFLLFGNIRKDKGHLFLSSIWKRFFNLPNDPYLWIIGHDEDKLSKKILSHNSRNIILHNSYVPFEIISCIYQKSDFAILPYLSSYSGGSGPLMKGAFTHSKLAIVANVSEMGRLAKEKNLAEYFESENHESLLSCVRRVLKMDEDFYSKKIKKAYQYANDRDWSNLARRFIDNLL